MSSSVPVGLHTSTPAELRARLDAGRRGTPFLVWRDARGEQALFSLPADGRAVTVGRGSRVDVDLAGDARVSRLHAIVEQVAGRWVVSDDGLSRHGSRLNGTPLTGRRRLEHGDLLTLGETTLVFLDASVADETHTASSIGEPIPPLTEADRRLLDVLCEPLLVDTYAAPASNRALADALCLSEARVKARLGTLFIRFGVDDLPQNQKRAGLAAAAVRLGLVRGGASPG